MQRAKLLLDKLTSCLTRKRVVPSPRGKEEEENGKEIKELEDGKNVKLSKDVLRVRDSPTYPLAPLNPSPPTTRHLLAPSPPPTRPLLAPLSPSPPLSRFSSSPAPSPHSSSDCLVPPPSKADAEEEKK